MGTNWIYKKQCYRMSQQLYPQFPVEVRRTMETGDSRYIMMFNINDKKNAYNYENNRRMF